ncbi:carbohydrate ABC transporter permease [Actinomadura parmotrematis]|uniref:Sugar ABC transporter permease n=1 Tax=Actinomadura parmotrematis TaxID=2864039 RepID=A0ABS7FLR8_9ACTN|nr:sugar ABC transporter permease [Actinomadura parmotrematis]MBW8481318.1 sugar ABC transporter permease [Actinomadura parmotrematis]
MTVLTKARPARPRAAAPTGAAARRRRRATPYLLLAPGALVLLLVVGYPLVRLVLISFQDYGLRTLFTGTAEWTGLDNYAKVLGSDEIVPMLLRTAALCVAMAGGTLAIGTAVALLMRALGPRMRTAVTLVLITAWAVPNVAATMLWTWLFQPTYGVVNWMLTRLRVFGDFGQYDWTAHTWSSLVLVWLLVVWQSVPFVALTLYAGLTQIPADYYEAAALDGAGAWRRFRVVTVPFLRSILLLVTVLSVVWDFNVFNQIWLLTHGGPDGATSTLVVWSFTRAFASQSYGQGAAIAVLATGLLMALTWYYVRRLVRTGEEL